MNVIKPTAMSEKVFMKSLIKRLTYKQIIRLIVESKTGDGTAWNKISEHSIKEAVDSLEWVISVAKRGG